MITIIIIVIIIITFIIIIIIIIVIIKHTVKVSCPEGYVTELISPKRDQ